MTTPAHNPSVAEPVPGQIEALLEHFEQCPLGMFLLDGERRFLAAKQGFARLTGIKTSILVGSTLRRFLSTEAPGGFEESIFAEAQAAGHWLGQVDFRSSIG